jgi:uncharacterized protein YggU (UPF0235/DUF167 family)
MDAALCYRLHADGIDLLVRLTPNARREGFCGAVEGAEGAVHLAAHVRAVPEKGKANDALAALAARALDVPRTAVSVISGATARLKTLRVIGDPNRLAAAVEALAAPSFKT